MWTKETKMNAHEADKVSKLYEFLEHKREQLLLNRVFKAIKSACLIGKHEVLIHFVEDNDFYTIKTSLERLGYTVLSTIYGTRIIW